MGQSKLDDPFTIDTILEIRTSGMKRMPGINVESGIDKQLRNGPMKLGKLGLEGDEHDLTFHGGPDKAILGYCSSHYPSWQEQYPERRDKFVPGGFGENFVTRHMNERNVCIGDVMSVGHDVLLQVSLPRMPCYKLNHRFSLKGFAPTTYAKSRTGWYYRVLREGSVSVGDEIKLVERKWPKWTIERLQEYLHRDKENFEMNKELSEIEELGGESRNQFRRRVDKARNKREPKKAESWRDFKVKSRTKETPRVISLVLEAVKPDDETEAKIDLEGAHARIKLPNGLERTYSVVSGDVSGSASASNHILELGVALDVNSRGGSRYIHESLNVGDIIPVGKITNGVIVGSAASHHLFVVGGIGITAFLALIGAIKGVNYSYSVHLAVRSAEEVAFKSQLDALGGDVHIYDKSKGERMDLQHVIETAPWNSHLYVCGPTRMMDAAKAVVKESQFKPDEVHYEAFAADTTGDPFEAAVANKDGKVVKVEEGETLLEVLRKEFGDAPSSCEVGNCGTCKVTLKSGRVDHRGSALLPDEKATSILACVSRGVGKIEIEI